MEQRSILFDGHGGPGRLNRRRLVEQFARTDQPETNVSSRPARGDHDLNSVKAETLDEIAKPLRMASAEEIEGARAPVLGFLGF